MSWTLLFVGQIIAVAYLVMLFHLVVRVYRKVKGK